MIEALALSGDDALSNQFELVIPAFPGVIDQPNTMIRVTDFALPANSIETYTVEYKTQKMTKFNGKNGTPNQFTFTFRIDKYWKIYEGFENWHNLVINKDTGAMSPDVVNGQQSLIRVSIDVIPADSNGIVTKKGWTFTGCVISELAGVTFNQEGTPLTAEVTMQFIKKIARS